MERGAGVGAEAGREKKLGTQQAQPLFARHIPVGRRGGGAVVCVKPMSKEKFSKEKFGEAETAQQAEWGARRDDIVFDGTILDELASMFNDDELNDYLALLEPTVQRRVHDLSLCLESCDWQGLLDASHALAGGAACYGLIELSAVARLAENGARCLEIDAVRTAVSRVDRLAAESLRAVAHWRRRLEAARAETD